MFIPLFVLYSLLPTYLEPCSVLEGVVPRFWAPLVVSAVSTPQDYNIQMQYLRWCLLKLSRIPL